MTKKLTLSTNLGGDIVRSPVLQEDLGHFVVSLLSGNVQGGVLVLGGGVGISTVLKQQHHVVHIAQARRDVKRRLLLLFAKTVQRGKTRIKI